MSNIDYQKLLAGLELRGMSVEQFAALAALAGIRFCSKARLNESFREKNAKPLRPDVAAEIWRLWQEVEAMCYEALPWPVDLSNAKRVDTSLQIYRGLAVLKGKDGKHEVPS